VKPSLKGSSVALIGAGNMGLAMLEGWAERGLSGADVAIVDPNPSRRLTDLCAVRGFGLTAEPVAGSHRDAVILAVKPQMLEAGAQASAPFIGPRSVVVSILAGKRISDIAARLPAAKAVVRAMPNTPAAIGRGMTGAFANPETTEAQRRLADGLLKASGQVEWVEREELIDAVTAVSGSGPAYVFHLIEAMAAGGVAQGLAPDVAMKLARATVCGAGELAWRSPETASQLRINVTSPGGTTAAALSVLMDETTGFPPLLEKAIKAAADRGRELGK